MRFNPSPLITLFLLLSISSLAQDPSSYDLLLRSGTVRPEKNINAENLTRFNSTASRSEGKSFVIIQFEKIPDATQRQQLSQAGIELLDFIPGYAYTATVTGSLDETILNTAKARAIIEPTAMQKMQPELARGNFPSWAIKSSGAVDVWISFPKTFSWETVKKELQEKGFEMVVDDWREYRVVGLRVPVTRLGELALQPFIEYVQAAPGEDKPLNNNSLALSKGHILRSSAAYGGKDLNGQGVVVGIGDDGDLQTHVDFTNRLISRAGGQPKAHATHVAGTVGGAGIYQEPYAGNAPKSTIVGQLFSQILRYASTYVQDYGMVITNNSYASIVSDCSYAGSYDLSSRILDQQAFDLPELQNVFAAGNNGLMVCGPNPTYKTVTGGYQSAKNVLTVGSTNLRGNISNFSSRGPVKDGRTKPEIMAQGEFLISTWWFNQYSVNNGTSMATPGVSGGLALLIQAYRNMHAGANPKSGLLKAILCNGALDKWNTGSDYLYGFGNMNLLRSHKIIEDATYFTGSLVDQANHTDQLVVPAGTKQLKVLLYWQDPPATVMASKTLVNDLDLEVKLGATTFYPTRPDSSSVVSGVINNSADHINNIEQVVINDPVPGLYDLKVIASMVAQNPSQEYFLVYDMLPESIVLTNPIGGESFVPTISPFLVDTVYINWDSYGQSSTFGVEFFNGTSWSTLNSNVAATERAYGWAVPTGIATDAARIRITKNATAITQTSFPFVITDMPYDSLTPVQCEGYIQIGWRPVPGATDYEVMWLRGDEMVSKDIVNSATLNYTFSGLSKDSTYWVTVRPRINGNPGRRAIAVFRQPNSGTCSGGISDNDLKLDAIISPASSGRQFSNSALSANTDITIRIKNLDDQVSSGNIDVSYSINGGAPVTATITTLTTPSSAIPAGSTIDYTFSTQTNLSAVGTYSIEVKAIKATDPVTANNSLTKVFKQLDNAPFTNGDLPWTDDVESAAVQNVNIDQLGLTGRDRYDFVNSTAFGQLRTFINTGIAYSGSKAITLDRSIYDAAGNIDSLTGTFNLGNFTTADELRLDFRYKNHGQKSHAANRVWIRGSETSSWIQVYDLFANQDSADGSYRLSTSIELNDSLVAHGQVFTPTFQVRWGQWGQYMAADNETGAGYTFDDIRLYKAIDDLRADSILTPKGISCSFGASVPVKAVIRNTSPGPLNSIPIVMRVDGVIVATETITATIPANDTIQYLFTATANLSSGGNHQIDVWVDYPSDNVPTNDTVSIIVKSLPYITSFPYLENFENGDGNWYTLDWLRSSWEYGTPNSAKIKRAASGTKAWKTNLTSYYNDNEFSYLYSPCFNLSGMTVPTLSFSLALDAEDCGAGLCDAGWMEYSDNGGLTWNRLGAFGQGTNWYNKNYAGNPVWSKEEYTRWHVATTALPTVNNSNIRFRFAFVSDAFVNKDGMGVDDIHIYDNIYGIYTGASPSPIVTQSPVNGTNWINFLSPAGTGQLIASVNPNGQDLGSTDVRAYIHPGPVRTNSGQYYHNRNITIKPTNINLADSATVRFYFLDSETEDLINATGCASCYKPSMAYELGVSKYSDPNDFYEDGVVENSLVTGGWHFIHNSKIKFVPFDKGYYAEFKVKDFSEFWLNNGGFDGSQSLPLQLVSFDARKKNIKDVLAEWTTMSETNVNRFEIELAKGNAAYLQNLFIKIGEVRSQGNSTQQQQYSFTDGELGKTGVRYYRLKIVDNDGSFKYSPIRAVTFDASNSWVVSPNPSKGLFNLSFQANRGERVSVKLYDLAGKTVKQYIVSADGFVQKLEIDLRDTKYSSGLYLLEATLDGSKQSFRLLKQ